ncbi:unnamed protein product [Bemisia tabaci]|uniref:Uncharacterized protein n=1 Tax=Bemisia tabaci TaxID=7038 RepID=A0A9P0G0M5_BEMTA|nr:unnamed protein product [Bemisia tabaci]
MLARATRILQWLLIIQVIKIHCTTEVGKTELTEENEVAYVPLGRLYRARYRNLIQIPTSDLDKTYGGDLKLDMQAEESHDGGLVTVSQAQKSRDGDSVTEKQSGGSRDGGQAATLKNDDGDISIGFQAENNEIVGVSSKIQTEEGETMELTSETQSQKLETRILKTVGSGIGFGITAVNSLDHLGSAAFNRGTAVLKSITSSVSRKLNYGLFSRGLFSWI